jgi:hypothetical protein
MDCATPGKRMGYFSRFSNFLNSALKLNACLCQQQPGRLEQIERDQHHINRHEQKERSAKGPTHGTTPDLKDLKTEWTIRNCTGPKKRLDDFAKIAGGCTFLLRWPRDFRV